MTIHFVDERWNLRSYVIRALALEVVLNKEDEVPHETAGALKEFFDTTLAEFNLKAFSLTTDAASVMDCLRRLLANGCSQTSTSSLSCSSAVSNSSTESISEADENVKGLRCFCHVLHCAVKKSQEVPQLASAIAKVRETCKAIKKSNLLTARLAQACKGLSLPHEKIVLDMKMRWGYSKKKWWSAIWNLKMP